jgi:hypothetical protein
MADHLETDTSGNIITKPAIGWATTTVAGMAVILAVEYIETPEELEEGTANRSP